jgi:uncharacterized protein (TIGR02594 family)
VAQPQTSGPSLLLEAIRWTGATIQQVSVPSNSECAELLNLILGKTGRGITPSGAVRLILEKYGKQLDGVRMGALVVLTRGRNVGIIGIVRGTDGAGNPIVISGHHGNKVSESIYSTNKVLGYFMPDKCGGSSAR